MRSLFLRLLLRLLLRFLDFACFRVLQRFPQHHDRALLARRFRKAALPLDLDRFLAHDWLPAAGGVRSGTGHRHPRSVPLVPANQRPRVLRSTPVRGPVREVLYAGLGRVSTTHRASASVGPSTMTAPPSAIGRLLTMGEPAGARGSRNAGPRRGPQLPAAAAAGRRSAEVD